MTRAKANMVLLLAGAVWGMGFVAQSTAMEAIGPTLFVGLRFALAFLVVLPFAIVDIVGQLVDDAEEVGATVGLPDSSRFGTTERQY